VRSPRIRFLAAAAAPLLLVVAACSPDTDGDDVAATSGDDAAVTSAGPAASLADVSVEKDGDIPTLTWDGEPFAEGDLPFVTYETQTEQVAGGDGDEVPETAEVEVRYLAVNGANGEQIVSTFENEETVTMDLNNESLFPAFLENLPGTQVGEALLMALPASEAFGPAGNPQFGVGPQDTMVFYLEIEEANEPLAMAEGEQVEPEDGLPTVEADGESAAQIDVEGVDDPEELVVQPLIEGERKEVRPGQLVRVHYTGVTLSDGEQFDTSYERGEPFEFQVGAGRVIPGWEEGLIGQTVGSRVLLVIPAAQAYGEAPEGADDASATATANPQAHPLEGEDLVFVVDILGAY
jgi:peptidylprolyl isomerase